jgi:hypothetical protein
VQGGLSGGLLLGCPAFVEVSAVTMPTACLTDHTLPCLICDSNPRTACLPAFVCVTRAVIISSVLTCMQLYCAQ